MIFTFAAAGSDDVRVAPQAPYSIHPDNGTPSALANVTGCVKAGRVEVFTWLSFLGRNTNDGSAQSKPITKTFSQELPIHETKAKDRSQCSTRLNPLSATPTDHGQGFARALRPPARNGDGVRP